MSKSTGWGSQKVRSAKFNFPVWFHLSCSRRSDGKTEPESMNILRWWDVTDDSYHANAVANSVAWEDEFVSLVWPCSDKMMTPFCYCWVEPIVRVPWALLAVSRGTYIIVRRLSLQVLHLYCDLQFFAEWRSRQLKQSGCSMTNFLLCCLSRHLKVGHATMKWGSPQ